MRESERNLAGYRKSRQDLAQARTLATFVLLYIWMKLSVAGFVGAQVWFCIDSF